MSLHLVVKVVVIGDQSVGKTALVRRLLGHHFDQDVYDATIGVDFASHRVDLPGASVKLQIWDTAGQEVFRSITRMYFRHVACALVVCDVTDHNSVAHVAAWVQDLHSSNAIDHSRRTTSVVVVANKTDRTKERKVSPAELQSIADALPCRRAVVVETSATQGLNVELAFRVAAELAMEGVTCGDVEIGQGGSGVRLDECDDGGIPRAKNVNAEAKSGGGAHACCG